MAVDLRLPALRRFALAITILNLLGHFVLGFEPSWAQLVVSVATAYGLDLLLETIDAWNYTRRPRFVGGPLIFVEFLLPAHISGLAVSMLMYASDRLLPFVFAASVAIASKAIFVVRVNGVRRHFLNPSNVGLATTLLLFHSVSIVVPYQFTENLSGLLYWALPLLIVCTGSFLNWRFTKRLPVIVAWLGGFVGQAVVRHLLFGSPLVANLAPMTGVAFLLFTFYMAPDPGTTPSRKSGQLVFGAGVAAAYGVLVICHIVYALFLGLVLVCTARGFMLAMFASRKALVRRAELSHVSHPITN